MSVSQYQQAIVDLEAIEQMQEIGLRLLARRALMVQLTRAAMHNVGTHVARANNYLIYDQALAFVEAERTLTDAERAEVRHFIAELGAGPGEQRALPAASVIQATSKPVQQTGPRSLPPAPPPNAAPQPSFNRQIEGLNRIAASVQSHTEDDEDEYEKVAAFLGRRAL
jgi:hypothetical protein